MSVQICRWEFLAFSGTFKTLLNVDEERDAGRLVFSLIKSSFMKDFEGQWQVRHLICNCKVVLILSDIMQHCMLCLLHITCRPLLCIGLHDVEAAVHVK